MRPLALDPDRIAELIHGALAAPAGAWSMGVQGALAEFAVVGDEAVETRRSGPGGRTVEAVTAGGGIRLTITDDTVAYSAGPDRGITLAVPRRVLPAPSLKVTAEAADPGALRPEHQKSVLLDLAVGHSAAAPSAPWISSAIRSGSRSRGRTPRSLHGPRAAPAGG
ncbi:MAG TPA: hypothetical protein VFF24_15100 [Acidimicrobiia bacterium]|nr:hypothetical protein [Acidimicrobiia bacterium]